MPIGRTPDLTILPSPPFDWKIWKALYLCGCLVVGRHGGRHGHGHSNHNFDRILTVILEFWNVRM